MNNIYKLVSLLTSTVTRLISAYVDEAAEVALLSRINDVTGLLAERSAGDVASYSAPRFLIFCIQGF